MDYDWLKEDAQSHLAWRQDTGHSYPSSPRQPHRIVCAECGESSVQCLLFGCKASKKEIAAYFKEEAQMSLYQDAHYEDYVRSGIYRTIGGWNMRVGERE